MSLKTLISVSILLAEHSTATESSPVQVQVYGPDPETLEAAPKAQRFVEGAIRKDPP